MRLGERVELIKKLARTLSEQSWTDMNLVLRQAGLTTPNWSFDDIQDNDGRVEYIVRALETATDDTLVELNDYLHSATHATPRDEPWEPGMFRLFVTHLAKHRALAAYLKNRVGVYGIDAFVAHDDIEPTKKWQQVIESALVSCDALLAILHVGFKESNWCDQEVGYVLGRNVPVIPLSYDLQPYGFLGVVQSLAASRYPVRQGMEATHPVPAPLVSEIVRLLLREPRVGATLTEHMVDALVHSWNWDQSNSIAPLLASDAPIFTADHLRRLREAQSSNYEVSQAFEVEPALQKLISRFGLVST